MSKRNIFYLFFLINSNITFSSDLDDIFFDTINHEKNNNNYHPSKFSNDSARLLLGTINKKLYQKKKFSNAEDFLITSLRSKDYSWKEIATLIPNRTPRQIRERFRDYLSQERLTSPWTKDEDYMLLESIKLYGNKWKLISKIISGRTSVDIKNRANNLKRNKIFLSEESEQLKNMNVFDDFF